MLSRSPRLAAVLTAISFTSAAVGLVCLRLVLKLDFIDPQTGFYAISNFWGGVFACLYAAFILALFVFAYRRRLSADMPLSAFRGAVPAACVLGLAISIPEIINAISLAQGLKISLLRPLSALFDVLALLIGVGAGLSFVWLARKLWTKAPEQSYAHSTLFALPVLWRCFVLVDRFVSNTAPSAVSDNMINVLLDVFAVLFLVAHARAVTRLSTQSNGRRLCFFGYAYALTALLVFIPWVGMVVSGKTPFDPLLAARWVTDIALAGYGAVCAWGATTPLS